MLKRLFYASATLFLLALTAHLVTLTVWRGPHPKIAAMAVVPNTDPPVLYVITPEGDVYVQVLWGNGYSAYFQAPTDSLGRSTSYGRHVGNFWERAAYLHD